MRAPLTPLHRKLPVVAMAMLLALTLSHPVSAEEAAGDPDAPMLASLMASGAGHVSAAVALEDDPEPVVGSFAVDGLTYVILDDARVCLVSVGSDAVAFAGADGSAGAEGAGRGVSSGWTTSPQPLPAPSAGASGLEDDGLPGALAGASVARIAASAAAGVLAEGGVSEAIEGATLAGSLAQPGIAAEGAAVAPSDALAPRSSAEAADPTILALPESVEYDGVAYTMTAIGSKALAGCDVGVVSIPASVESVDEAALRGSSVASVEVADGNPKYSSFDGVLYDAEQSSLLLIPEGKQGAVRIPSNTESVPPSAFSHCAYVTSVSVDAGSAAFSSRNGLLYNNDGTTLLRVPAGATDVEVADGCTTVAASALEGCSQLRSIQAPASVAEVDPGVLGASAPEGLAASDSSASPSEGGPAGPSSDQGTSDAVGTREGTRSPDAAGPSDGDGDAGAGAAGSLGGGRDVSDASVPAASALEDGTAPADARPGQLSSLVALSGITADASADMPSVDPAAIAVRLLSDADPAPWEALGFAVELVELEGPGAPEGEPMGGIAPGDAAEGALLEFDPDSDGPTVVDEVTVDYGYANERSSANGAYERAVPKVVASLRLQPLLAEGLAAEPLGEDSLATASFLYEGCLYVIDPEGGAALVAVDPKRLAECAEDPTTLILPDYVDDGQWAYPLTRIAKGALRDSGVERLWIPASATYLDYALEGCETLRYVEISEDSPVYSSKGGCLYDKSGETLWMAPEGLRLPDDSREAELETASAHRFCSDPMPSLKVSKATLYSDSKGAQQGADVSIAVYHKSSHEVGYFRLTQNSGQSRCSREHTSEPWKLYANVRFELPICIWSGIAGVNSENYPSSDPYSTYNSWRYGLYKEGYTETGVFAWNHAVTGRVSASPNGPGLASGFIETDPPNALFFACESEATHCSVVWDDGNASSTTQVAPGSFLTAPSPSRTGYSFAGWYTAASGGSYVCGAGGSVTVTSDVTYYAHWSPITYNVRYFDHAGNLKATDTATYDKAFSLRGNPGWTPAGYTAKGWARSKGQAAASNAFGQANVRNLASTQGANADFYVAQAPNPYSVRYFTKAAAHIATDSKAYGSTFALRGDPGRTTPGYTAVGWARTANQASASHAFGQSVSNLATSGNADFYLAERPNSYQVSLAPDFPAFATGAAYEGYGPHGVSKDAGTPSVTATFDAGMPSATMPRATGYAFQGYFDDAGTMYYDANGASVRNWDKPGNATLHGRWSVVRHELTLDAGNGEVPSAAARGWVRDPGGSGLYRLSYSIEWVEESGGSPRIQLPVPATKPGYSTFDGWVGPNLSKPSKSVIVQPWELADKAYAGVFSGLIGYAASLDLAGGRLDPAPEGWSEASGSWTRGFTVETEAFSLPTPVRDGYAFEGWRAVGEGDLGEPAKEVAVPKGSWGDRSWVASWEAVEYRIGYELAGGSLSGEPTTYTVESPDFELPQPTRDGYSFEGWQVEGANGTGILQQGTATTVRQGTWGDLHATAAWATVGYTASLDLAGGGFASAPAGWSESGGSWTRGFTVESDAFALPAPARAGHDFLGWALVASDGSLGSPDPSASVPKGTVGDRSFKAVWEARTYSITWHYAGQVIDGKQSDSSTQAYGDPIAFPTRPSEADPAREHYEFAGWFTEREGGERVTAGAYLLERDATFYARWVPVEYVVHLHLGDDDAYAEHKAHVEKDGQALPMAPDGHFDMAYTVEDEVTLPTVTDDPSIPKPVREGMEFKGWVECDADGSFDADLVPSALVTLPKGSHGERHFRAVWAFALRFEVPSAVGFRFDLADDSAFADAPYGPVQAVSGDGVELRSLSLGSLAVADVQLDVAGAQPDAIATDRSKVFLRVRDASLPEPGYGWVLLPTTSAPEGIDRFDLADVGFGDANPIAPLASKPLRYEIEVQDPTTTLAGEVDGLPLAKVVFTVKGLW